MPANKGSEQGHEILAYNTPSVEQGLSRERIVEAALELLNESGLKGMTTRRLAERLGVNSSSLYWHIKNKAQLMQLLADRISAEIDTPDVRLDWQEQLRQYAESYRQVLLSNRDAVKVFTDTLPFTLNRLRQIEGVYRILSQAGFSLDETSLIGAFFNNFVMGFVAEEVRLKSLLEGPGEKAEKMAHEIRRAVENLPVEEFPTLTTMAKYLFDVDMDRQFHFQLDILLEGLKAKRAANSGGQKGLRDSHDEKR